MCLKNIFKIGILFVLLCGCGNNESTKSNDNVLSSSNISSSTISTSTPTEYTSSFFGSSSSENNLNQHSVGLGYVCSFISQSNTEGQADITIAFAAFDKENKIYDVRFDSVQIKFAINDEYSGLKLKNTNLDEDYSVKTKQELGSSYGMLNYGGAVAEWNIQAEYFADWCVGKTIEEVIVGTPGAGNGEAINEELVGKVTISVDYFEIALLDAFIRKSNTTYNLNGTVGIAMHSGLAYNYGKPANSLYSDIAGVVANDGIVEAALIDAIVIPISFENGITIKNDDYYFRNGVLRSKKVLGDEYAMKGVGNNPATGETCTKEWYEQAAIVEKAAEGKTKTEISAFVANEGELAGATITLTNYIKALAKATDYAGRAVINAN